MIDITNIISTGLALIIALISTFLIPWLKNKVSAEKFEQIKEWTKVAVQAAEMIYNGVGRGEEKKTYVINYLNSKGFKVDTTTIDALIESAVLDLKRGEF